MGYKRENIMQNIQEIIEEKEIVGLEVGQAEDIAKRLSSGMLELTPEEIKLILAHREQKEKEWKKKHFTEHVLFISFQFYEWLKKTKTGATFSTFCDDFGYAGIFGYDRPVVYETVLELIKVAEKAAGERVS